MIMMYNILHGLDGIPFDDLFSTTNTAARSNGQLQALQKFLPTELQEIFLFAVIINDWNYLPQEVMANQIMYGLFKLDSYILETIQIFIYTQLQLTVYDLVL